MPQEAADEEHELVQAQPVDAKPLPLHRLQEDPEVHDSHLQDPAIHGYPCRNGQAAARLSDLNCCKATRLAKGTSEELHINAVITEPGSAKVGLQMLLRAGTLKNGCCQFQSAMNALICVAEWLLCRGDQEPV